MTTPRQLSRTEWTDFHWAYAHGSTTYCPQCATSGKATLKRLDRMVLFACGHRMSLPDNAEPLPRAHPAL
ncbi:hypothetical protein [Streptomyces kronopolitis]|uniref:hypothetical protein n=1 Tax=Streptomyces kronopolitis TaxID=1612435 RepID=UPI00342550C8